MEQNSPLCVTAKAPVNIAVIKYWGKRDEERILPINSSLSTTLNMSDLSTTTTVMASPSFERDTLWLNGEPSDIASQPRLRRCIEELRKRATDRKSESGDVVASRDALASGHYKLHIVSNNNFPTAAGLASSAAGFACLAYTVGQVLGVQGDLSELARQGSGSACRSIYGGFVKWVKGEKDDGSDSIAVQVADEKHWEDLQIVICVVSDKRKDTSSTSGMLTSTQTSDLLRHRAENIVEPRMQEMEEAIKNKDFQKFGEITMRDSNQFHATCLDTYPPIFYMNDTSKAIIHLVTAYNRRAGKIKAAYTFDAGPNAVLYALKEDLPELLRMLVYYFPPNPQEDSTTIPTAYFNKPHLAESSRIPADLATHTLSSKESEGLPSTRHPGCVTRLIHTNVGPGPYVVSPEFALIDTASGLPKL